MLRDLAIHGSHGPRATGKSKPGHGQFTTFHCDSHGSSVFIPSRDSRATAIFYFDHTPPKSGRPEINTVPGAGRFQADLPDPLVKGKTRVRIHQSVTGERPNIIAPTFHVVPRVAARTVMPSTGSANDGKTFLNQPPQDEMRGQHILQTR